MAENKQEIRQFARAARAGIAAERRPLLAASAAGRLTTLPESLSASTILGYMAIPEELDPAPALDAFVGRRATVLYPRVAGPGALTLHAVRSDEDLETGHFGILQPTIASPRFAPDDVDLVIVPGVAFDVFGRRLGFGGGYYDRLLPSMPRALRVGYAFDEQLLGTVPHDDDDALVDVIVTPSKVVRVQERGD
jgi:5-formyltetrahydrofolate cyclo-ligase